MKNTAYLLFGLSLAAICWGACQKESNTSSSSVVSTKELKLPLPDYKYNLGTISPSFNRSGINSEKANLGRVLFYDQALSVSNSVACASCHNQANAFSDFDALSAGFTGDATDRNSMALFNLGSNGRFFWDLRRTGLQDMVLDPAVHLVEMGMESREKIAEKVAGIPYYQTLFQEIYHTKTPSVKQIEESLSEFLMSLVSGSAKFDKVMSGNITQFTGQEQRGHSIFIQSGCTNCHGGNNFNNQNFTANGQVFLMFNGGGGWGTPSKPINLNSVTDFANIGLEYDYTDPGMKAEMQEEVGLPSLEQGLFKIPSLRNVALTGPYMHDGRFATLFDVINHYDHGVKKHPDLDSRLQTNAFDPNTGEPTGTGIPRRLNLSQQDKEDLVAFLNTLTDYQFISDPKYSNPFQ